MFVQLKDIVWLSNDLPRESVVQIRSDCEEDEFETCVDDALEAEFGERPVRWQYVCRWL